MLPIWEIDKFQEQKLKTMKKKAYKSTSFSLMKIQDLVFSLI